MMRTILVGIHAGAGVGGLIVGLPVLAPPANARSRWLARRLYAGLVAALLVSMVVLIAVDWARLEIGARGAFLGLTALGAVMAYRLARAHGEAGARTAGWQTRYIGHIYFTYVSLWIGFLVVPALNTSHPQVAIPVMVTVVLGLGHFLVARYTQRVLAA